MKSVSIPSLCKINLCLRVHELQANGYHRIETVMAKLDLHDDADISIDESGIFHVSVPGFPELENEKNLVIKAARAYFQAAGLKKGVQVRVTKRIPIGGGLGGGSGNAAAVLTALQAEFQALTNAKLLEMAATLGADVPFFVDPSSWAYATGVGEKLHPMPALSPLTVLLVNPGFPVSTPTAYKALSRSLTWQHPSGSSIRPENRSDLDRLLEIGNDLEPVVIGLFPDVEVIRNELKKQGAFFAQMSGSGSTVFGLFEDEQRAKQALEKLNPKWQKFLTRSTI